MDLERNGRERDERKRRPAASGRERRRYKPETGQSGQARARAMARRRRRQRQRRLILGTLFLAVLLLVGGIGFGVVRYRDLKERQAFALTGIEAMEQENYEAAITSFDQALEKSNGKIGAFEKDVLLYRAEAEYKQEDFPAARNTYELLMKED